MRTQARSKSVREILLESEIRRWRQFEQHALTPQGRAAGKKRADAANAKLAELRKEARAAG